MHLLLTEFEFARRLFHPESVHSVDLGNRNKAKLAEIYQPISGLQGWCALVVKHYYVNQDQFVTE